MINGTPKPADDAAVLVPSTFARNLNRTSNIDIVCFSHLRWDFVYQRPQHLLKRCAREHRVFFVEEPILGMSSMHLEVSKRVDGIQVVVPYLPEGLCSEVATTAVMREMVQHLFHENGIHEYLFWYYTPMALTFTNDFTPVASVYDCMDELSGFVGADSRLPQLEKELFGKVDLVFTGGHSLYEVKRNSHRSVHPFPSSIDTQHFSKARTATPDPLDQINIPHPRLGFFGVIDERFDEKLLREVAALRPSWQFVMIGPVVKIDPERLPRAPNIHYLGAKQYEELPSYLANWDIALLLFARNASTRFISPTKTPEYLAAGKPVISTSIRDVVRPYGELKMVEIADTATEFIQCAESILSQPPGKVWLSQVDDYLSRISWDKTWSQMSDLINQTLEMKRSAVHRKDLKVSDSRSATATAKA